jgi:Putative sensor
MENRNYIKKQPKTYSNILYLLLSFPLGTIYFVILTIGLSLGVSTIIIWIGLPILLLTIAAIWGMAALERELAVQLLKVDIPLLLPSQPEARRTWHSWFGARIKNPLTWKSLIYLFIKFPLGIISFCLALTLPIVAFAFMFEPLVYLLNMNILSLIVAHGVQSNSWMPFVGFISPQFDVFQFARSFIGVPVGIALWLATRYLLNGLAGMCGEFARVMLSPTKNDMPQPKDEYSFYQYQPVNREQQQQSQQQ